MKTEMIVVLLSVGVLSGCPSPAEQEAQHQRELECIKMTGDRYCRSELEIQQSNIRTQHQPAPHYNPNMVDYGPVQPGQYHNYYGNPQYGTWGQDGRYYFNDPNSVQASETNSFLLGAGLGALGGYALSKADFTKSNPNGWVDQSRTVTKYYNSRGAEVNQTAYQSQKLKSDMNRQNYIQKYNQQKADYERKLALAKAQRDASLKQQQALNNQLKSKQTLTPSQIQQKKKEILLRIQQKKQNSGFGSYAKKESNYRANTGYASTTKKTKL